MISRRTLYLLGGACLLALATPASQRAAAWTTATGPRGGSAVVGHRGAFGVGPHGGAAAVGPRGAVAVGPYGRAGAVVRPGYRSPVVAVPVVPVYPGYARPVAPLAGTIAAGIVAGTVAGAIAGSAEARAIVPSPAGLTTGATIAVLPGGCTTQRAGSVTYYRCGQAWLRPYMQGPDVVYLVVPPP
ncbi:hypothetical protein [Roseococcus sp.]|uniref:hypothetical protein n=1 Tax=Roseococcus sp. TaxID=2109646 RepID=UPI003BA96801